MGFDASTPFGRLASTHVLSTAGDALVALVLAGSLFFSLDPSGARWRIALYLLFTKAPFALVGPLIGPAMDRMAGGRRVMLIGSAVGRALVAFLMVSSAGSDSLLLFPEAFVMLVLAKSYAVAKAAIVPTVVIGDHALVEANSKLQLLSGIAAFGAGVPGALLLWLFSPGAVAFVCALVFTAASVAALRVPVTTVAAEPEATDPWTVLGIARGTPRDEARKAFRALIAQYHPDKVAHLAPEFHALAERKTREILDAWEAVERDAE